MDNLVKQRLVGALILLALAVVFWPIIFVPGAQEATDVVVAVPDEPPIDRSPLPEPDTAGLRLTKNAQAQGNRVPDVTLPEDRASLEPLAQKPADERSLSEATDSLIAPAIDADGLPIAFSLQVATMGDKERAETLRDELVAAGYKGYLTRFQRDQRTLYRVLVGPKYSRADLLPIKSAVDSTWRVESMVIRYLP